MKFPDLTTPRFIQIQNISIPLIIAGTLAGIFGAVRSGAAIVAISASIFISIRYARGPRHRRIEIILPLALCALMFVVALTLPHAK